jgi:hypothetical protein
MPMLCRCSVRTLVLVVALALPRVATADPIAITSGHVESQILSPRPRVLLEGSGFLLDVALEGFDVSLALTCTPCAPGATVDLGARFGGPAGSGRATVDGVVFPQIFVDGITGTFDSPSFELTGAGDVTVTRPFAFSGVVSGFVLDPFVHGTTDPAFTKTLRGQGIVTGTFLFSDTGQPLFTAHDIRFDFSDAGAVPEPATLVLCISGTAALAARRHGRKRR